MHRTCILEPPVVPAHPRAAVAASPNGPARHHLPTALTHPSWKQPDPAAPPSWTDQIPPGAAWQPAVAHPNWPDSPLAGPVRQKAVRPSWSLGLSLLADRPSWQPVGYYCHSLVSPADREKIVKIKYLRVRTF